MNVDARLLVGAGIILLTVSLVSGFLIEVMPLERLALSAHLVGLLGSAFLIGLGAGWPALALAPRMSRCAAVAAIYGFCGGWLIYLFAAASGTGGMFPIASGGTHGSPVLESVISSALLTTALALFAVCGIVLSGVAGASATLRRDS